MFDEDFVRNAAIREESGDERLRRSTRVYRQEDLRRRLEDEANDKAAAQGRREKHAHLRRRRGRVRVLLSGFVIAGFVGGLNALGLIAESPQVSDAGTFRLWSYEAPPPNGKSRALGRPPDDLLSSNDYRFLGTQPGGKDEPVAYDPCRELHYVVNWTNAPPKGGTYIEQSIAEVSRATGFRFVFDGETKEKYNDKRAAFQPGRYGQKWAPILIDWSDPKKVSKLEGTIVGLGGSQAFAIGGRRAKFVYVTGAIALDTPAIREMLQTSEGPALVQAVILHELGHVMGLNHVDDPAQLMFEEMQSIRSYSLGDQNGLARLGSGRCFPNI